jgi:hypothetical protein
VAAGEVLGEFEHKVGFVRHLLGALEFALRLSALECHNRPPDYDYYF